jgi:hypothetical protein
MRHSARYERRRQVKGRADLVRTSGFARLADACGAERNRCEAERGLQPVPSCHGDRVAASTAPSKSGAKAASADHVARAPPVLATAAAAVDPTCPGARRDARDKLIVA